MLLLIIFPRKYASGPYKLVELSSDHMTLTLNDEKSNVLEITRPVADIRRIKFIVFVSLRCHFHRMKMNDLHERRT